MIPFMEFQKIVYKGLYGVSRGSLGYRLWSFKKQKMLSFMEFQEKVNDTVYGVSRKVYDTVYGV